jgi:hypothetical protein
MDDAKDRDLLKNNFLLKRLSYASVESRRKTMMVTTMISKN